MDVAWNPEFLREGFAVQDTLHPDRIVVGINGNRPGRGEEVAREIYAKLLEQDMPFLVTDLATSELVKTSANAFLATKISFINAIAELCADVTLVFTEWSQFRKLLPADLEGVVRQRNIIDGRNCLDRKARRAAGWKYRGVGRR